MDFLSTVLQLLGGVFQMPWWGYVVVALVLTHITIVSVTIFLHRTQAHGALDLHPVVSHFFRFWLWLTTGMVTKEWTAIHRKHHAACETIDDPHSPQILGIWKVLSEGSELYRKEAKNLETLEKHGKGTPDDWMEQHLYTKHSVKGVALMLITNLVLFGPIGLTMWAVQMLWIPIMAAGTINGIGHYWGYRNFEPKDRSTNISPWGILIGGEELHNNHHAFPTSARLSNKWYEFDIGWMYICVMQFFGLAKVKRREPRLDLIVHKVSCDENTVYAVYILRLQVLNEFAHATKSVQTEFVKSMRVELSSLWDDKKANITQLMLRLELWCSEAEESNITELRAFGRRLRMFSLKSA